MEGMRALLRSSLGESLRALTPLDRLAAAWPVACGPALAARGEPLHYAEGHLTVRVPDPLWLDQLRSVRPSLTPDLARIAAVPLREIHFEGPEPKPVRTTAAPPVDATRRRSTPARPPRRPR